jgi:CBS domain-containing protein
VEIVGLGKRVRIYIAEQDKAEGSHDPLWQALLDLLHKEGAAGATMFRALAGFGARSQVHLARLADIVPDLPIVVEWIDNPDRVARILPRASALVATGVITIEDVEIVKYTHRQPRPLPRDTVADVMTRSVIAVHRDTPVGELVRMLVFRDYRSLPVIDEGGRLIGMITNTDLVDRAGLRARVELLAALGSRALEDELVRSGARAKTAGDVMSQAVAAVGPDESLDRAAHLMVERQVKRLPVLDTDGRLIGIVSRLDILKAIGEGYPVPDRPEPHPPNELRTIRDLMRTDVIAVPAEASLGEIVDAVSASSLNRAVVVDAGRRVLGVVSDADILARLDPGEAAGLVGALMRRGRAAISTGITAREVMHSPPVTAVAQTAIPDAARLMVDARMKVLPITDPTGRLLGVVDRADLLSHLAGS